MPYHYSGSETVGTVDAGGAIIPVAACSTVLFPLGYRVMNTFARYRFTKLRFVYEPMVGSSTPGQVWLAFSPTPLTEPVGLNDVSTAASSSSGSVWAPVQMEVRYEPTQRWLLNYATGVWDYKGPDYNLGMLYALVLGAPAATLLGTLKVEYTVTLVDRARTLPNPVGPSALLARQALQDLLGQQVDLDQLGLLVRQAQRAQPDLPDLPDPRESPELQEHKDSPVSRDSPALLEL